MSDERPLYERDPEAWQRHLAEGNAKQPRKRVSAAMIMRDGAGRLFLVDPQYKPDWDIPGGMAEANEPPHRAVQRELSEELGLQWPAGRLLVVDWVSPHGPWDDLLAFVFDGGILQADEIAKLQVRDGELVRFGFCSKQEAEQRLRDYVWRRVAAALKALDNGCTYYLCDGYEV